MTPSTHTPEVERVTAPDFLEREAGCVHHRAVVMAELESTAEHAFYEFKDDPDAPTDWLAALKLIAETSLPIFERVPFRAALSLTSEEDKGNG